MPRRQDQRVWRAEFRDYIGPTLGKERVVRGRFAVEIGRFPYRPSIWVAMLDGDTDKVFCNGTTAANAKRTARRYFEAPLTDWVVGEKVDGQWRPVDEARERELRGAA